MSRPQPQATMSVRVVMERRPAGPQPWATPTWHASAVIPVTPGTAPADPPEKQGAVLRESEGTEQYLWTDLWIELYADGGEGYWHNLVGSTPSVFVICHPDGDDESRLRPVAVSVDPDDASSHMETDDPVFALPLPEDIHAWLERFVVENYVPKERRKRKRRRWSEEAGP